MVIVAKAWLTCAAIVLVVGCMKSSTDLAPERSELGDDAGGGADSGAVTHPDSGSTIGDDGDDDANEPIPDAGTDTGEDAAISPADAGSDATDAEISKDAAPAATDAATLHSYFCAGLDKVYAYSATVAWPDGGPVIGSSCEIPDITAPKGYDPGYITHGCATSADCGDASSWCTTSVECSELPGSSSPFCDCPD